jgi:hypothetical protein
MQTHTEPQKSSVRCLTTSCTTNCEIVWIARKLSLKFMIKSTNEPDHIDVSIVMLQDAVRFVIRLLLQLLNTIFPLIFAHTELLIILNFVFFLYNFTIPHELQLAPYSVLTNTNQFVIILISIVL